MSSVVIKVVHLGNGRMFVKFYYINSSLNMLLKQIKINPCELYAFIRFIKVIDTNLPKICFSCVPRPMTLTYDLKNYYVLYYREIQVDLWSVRISMDAGY